MRILWWIWIELLKIILSSKWVFQNCPSPSLHPICHLVWSFHSGWNRQVLIYPAYLSLSVTKKSSSCTLSNHWFYSGVPSWTQQLALCFPKLLIHVSSSTPEDSHCSGEQKAGCCCTLLSHKLLSLHIVPVLLCALPFKPDMFGSTMHKAK